MLSNVRYNCRSSSQIFSQKSLFSFSEKIFKNISLPTKLLANTFQPSYWIKTNEKKKKSRTRIQNQRFFFNSNKFTLIFFFFLLFVYHLLPLVVVCLFLVPNSQNPSRLALGRKFRIRLIWNSLKPKKKKNQLKQMKVYGFVYIHLQRCLDVLLFLFRKIERKKKYLGNAFFFFFLVWIKNFGKSEWRQKGSFKLSFRLRFQVRTSCDNKSIEKNQGFDSILTRADMCRPTESSFAFLFAYFKIPI